MPKCVVKNCKNHSFKKNRPETSACDKIKFYRMPTEVSLREKWIEACGYNSSNFHLKDGK